MRCRRRAVQTQGIFRDYRASVPNSQSRCAVLNHGDTELQTSVNAYLKTSVSSSRPAGTVGRAPLRRCREAFGRRGLEVSRVTRTERGASSVG